MSFRTRRVLFWSPIYTILTYLILNDILNLFDVKNKLLTGLLALFILFIQTVPMLFEQKNSTVFGRLFAKIFGIWQWFILMYLIYDIILYLINKFIFISKFTTILILLTIPLIGIYSYYNAHRLVVKKKTLEFDDIDREYNIIHLSDVHFGSIRHKKLIKTLANKLNELSTFCDLVIISGDLADGSCAVKEDDFNYLKDIDIPIIFTSGNHDYYPGIENVHKACKNAGMIVLENEGMIFDKLNIYGLSYSFDDISMPSDSKLHDFIRSDMINIVNYHIPNGWDNLSKLGFDLQLSGHTHGGQFYPVVLFGNLVYEGHNKGLFKDKLNHYLHVTTGVGCMDYPMRWGTNSELVVLKLKSTK